MLDYKKAEEIVILGNNIKPGTSLQLSVDVAKLPSRTPIDIPVFIERAKKPGPVVLLLAGIHGDEINGIEIVRRIIKSKINKPIAGTIITIPVVNIFGFINHSRELPDGKDLNRTFPGSTKGSLASKMAYILSSEIIEHVDILIDYHTGGEQRENYPQLRCSSNDVKSMALAKIFQPHFILTSNFREKSLRKEAGSRGKIVLLFEGGESMRIDEHVVKSGIDGTLRVLKQLNMRKEAPESDVIPLVFETTQWLRARASGIFHNQIKNGSFVNKGQLLGTLTDPYGDFMKKVNAPRNGFVICVNNKAVVTQGEALFHIALS